MDPIEAAAETRYPGSGSASMGDTETFQGEKRLDSATRKRLYHKNKQKDKRNENKGKFLASNAKYFQTQALTRLSTFLSFSIYIYYIYRCLDTGTPG